MKGSKELDENYKNWTKTVDLITQMGKNIKEPFSHNVAAR